MNIIYNQENQTFHLYNQKFSYLMRVVDEKYLVHLYDGKRVKGDLGYLAYPFEHQESGFSPIPMESKGTKISMDLLMQEYAGFGRSDYRNAAFEFTYADGTQATQFVYKKHEILDGKPTLTGLPHTRASQTEAKTLLITLEDSVRQVSVELSYTIFKDLPVVTRNAKILNQSSEAITLDKALSFSLDLDRSNFELIQFPGGWANEKKLVRKPITYGNIRLDSKRGASSGFQQPFAALVDPTTTETSGEARAFHFVYSGNFMIDVAVSHFQTTRVQVGINEFGFKWQLSSGEAFQTPEVVMVYSQNGLNEMSHAFHDLYNHHLIRGVHQNKPRPVLINNWETTYFNFDEEKIVELAQGAKKIGVELLVLDDGWFGKRNDDTTSLGDWFENEAKLPKGLTSLAQKVNEEGVAFGLWFEPEMISEESELYKAHPDWHLHVANYPQTFGRNQLILDYSRKEVREHIFEQMDAILSKIPVTYIKWDMNRSMTEVASRTRAADNQQETYHRYILGLYEMLEKLTTKYPNILFENCSGGAGRFDPGMIYYMPQCWTSDNTDAIERLKIQYSTSMMFPISTMCAQISDVPNHQVGRTTPLATRIHCAMSANLGVMLDLKSIPEADLQLITEKLAFYKAHKTLIQFGRFDRLLNPYTTNYCAWQFMDEKQEKGLVFAFKILDHVDEPNLRVPLVGLNPEKMYKIGDYTASGEDFMNAGIYLNKDLSGDFSSILYEITEI